MKPELINGLFALGGAILGVVGAWLIAKSNKDKQKLTVLASPIAKLLKVGDLAKSDVEIRYRGSPVEDLGAGEIAIQNSGSVSIDNIEIKIQPDKDSPVVDLNISSTNFSCDEDFISVSKDESGTYISTIKFLNPKDKIIFDYRVSGTNKPDVSIRKIGLDVEVKHEVVSWIPDIYADVLYRAIDRMPLPGYSWLFARIHKPYRLYRESKKEKA